MDDTKIVDYRQLRLHTLNEPRYAHLKLLLFWPSFGIVFYILEQCGFGTATILCPARWMRTSPSASGL